jgi:hypothetical protein
VSDFWTGFIAGVFAMLCVAFLVASVFADVSELGKHNRD